jgi:hypothetical protein
MTGSRKLSIAIVVAAVLFLLVAALRKNEVAAYARCPPLPPWTLRARETQEVVMVGLPKPGDIQKMLDDFHKELRAIRTLLEQLLELERERIERDQAA